MLDFPELLAPARIVSGRKAISVRFRIDLNPSMAIPEMASGSVAGEAGRALAVFFAIAFTANVSHSSVQIQRRGRRRRSRGRRQASAKSAGPQEGLPSRTPRLYNAPVSSLPKAPRSRLASRLLLAACLLTIGFLLLEILTYGYGRDQGIYAMVGRALLAGKMPYRDAWDFKPPGIFVIYAGARAIFGSGQWGIRALECLGLVAMVAAMGELTKRWWGERAIGILGGAIAVLVHAQLDFWHTAQPESFGGMLTIFALLVLGHEGGGSEAEAARGTTPSERERWIRRFACGVLFGLTGLLKPPLAGGGAVVAIALALQTYLRERSIRAAARPVYPIVLGGAAPLLLCAIWFAAKGALHDLTQVLFVFTPHYTKLGWEDSTVAGMAYAGFSDWLTEYSSVPTVGVLLLLGFRPTKRERPGVFLVAGIIAVHLVGVILQGKFFPYHYGATWPVTGLLAALGFWRVWDRLTTWNEAVGASLFFAGLTALALGRSATKDVPHSYLERCGERLAAFTRSPRNQAEIDRLASVADVNAAANRSVAGYLRYHVPPDRTVFVWGFEPVIYDLADRTPSTRYLYDVPQRVAWAKETERATLMKDLEASHPAAVVVEKRDVFPMVTGDAIDSNDTLQEFDALRRMLRERYWMAETIEDFDIYLER